MQGFGYQPLTGYQASLKEAMSDALKARKVADFTARVQRRTALEQAG